MQEEVAESGDRGDVVDGEGEKERREDMEHASARYVEKCRASECVIQSELYAERRVHSYISDASSVTERRASMLESNQ